MPIPCAEKDHDIIREEARELMRLIQAKSVECDPDRKVRPHDLNIFADFLT